MNAAEAAVSYALITALIMVIIRTVQILRILKSWLYSAEKQKKLNLKKVICMIFQSSEAFEKYVRDKMYEGDTCSTLYLIMRTGYSFQDLLQDSYCIEAVDPYFENDEDALCWHNDWYEGQQFIELYDIIPEDKMLELLLHLRRNNEDELTD